MSLTLTDTLADTLAEIRRPQLMIRAARIGLAEYRRERDLKRLLKADVPPAPATALAALMVQEADLEQTRRCGAGGYSPARHVELLIAVLAEARLLGRKARVSAAPCAQPAE